ncbi:MAG: SDR family oxidoreductase [Gemmatimonadota bacterium]|nr:SDR family oxidoreductase [Gemmatimonadota bacterium]
MERDSAQRTLFITGTNSGFGKATVELFAAEGWRVAATVRDKQAHETLFAGLAGVKLYELDVDDFEQVEQVAAQAVKDFGRIDVVVNNAGYCLMGPAETSTMEQIRRQFRTNTLGVFAVTKAFLPHMREAGGGTVINIASASAMFNYPFVAAYGASKWAVRGLTEGLAAELAPFNIVVKGIYPGFHATGIFTKLDQGAAAATPAHRAYKPYYANMLSAQKALPNAGSPARIARAIHRAATSPQGRPHIVSGLDAKLLLLVKRLLPQRAFLRLQTRSILAPASKAQTAFMRLTFGRNQRPLRMDLPDDLH